MPARQKMTPVEVMILLAILGILASIALPAMKQAQGRVRHAQRAARQYSAPRAASASDGQLNTIEVSELSRDSERAHPEQWVGALIGLLPVVVAVAFIYVFVKRLRQQVTRRRAR